MPAKTIGYCFSCDRQGIPVYDVKAVDPWFKACYACRAKHTTKGLRSAANALVAARTPKSPDFHHCRHCDGPVIAFPTGGVPLLCDSCVREWHQIGADAAALGVA